MNKFIALLSVVVASSVVASAETLLNVTLTPALDCSHANALFLRVTTPEPVQNYACVQTCVVNEPCEKMGVGSFVADLSAYDGIEFIIQAPPGLEINLRPSSTKHRIVVEFQAKAADCTASSDNVLFQSGVTQVAIQGSNVAQLESLFQSQESFVEISNCLISTRIQFSPNDYWYNAAASFEGSVTEIRWSLEFDDLSVFAGMSAQVYEFDTMGSSWIHTTLDGALAAAPSSVNCSICKSYNPSVASRSGLSAESLLTNHTCGTSGDTSDCCHFSSVDGHCSVFYENAFLYPCSGCETATAVLTGAPTKAPTKVPTEAPTQVPTNALTSAPTEAPTEALTEAPTVVRATSSVVDSTTMPTAPEAASGAEISTLSAVCAGLVIGAANALLLWNGLAA